MAEKIKKLEKLFQQQADKKGPCPLPDPQTNGTRSIEHTGLIRLEPQPTGWRYDQEDNEAESKGFEKTMWRKFEKGELVNNDGTPMTKNQLEELLKQLKG